MWQTYIGTLLRIKSYSYGIRLSHIFKIRSISNEIPSISNERPGISIEIPRI